MYLHVLVSHCGPYRRDDDLRLPSSVTNLHVAFKYQGVNSRIQDCARHAVKNNINHIPTRLLYTDCMIVPHVKALPSSHFIKPVHLNLVTRGSGRPLGTMLMKGDFMPSVNPQKGRQARYYGFTN
jgi:hypothetical protein